MTWFDTLLNWTLPPIIFICLGYWMYKVFKPMVSGLGGAISGQYDKLRGETERSKGKNITYE